MHAIQSYIAYKNTHISFLLTQPITAMAGLSLRFQVAGENTTSRWGIKQLGISFGSIFLLFSYESSRGPRS